MYVHMYVYSYMYIVCVGKCMRERALTNMCVCVEERQLHPSVYNCRHPYFLLIRLALVLALLSCD